MAATGQHDDAPRNYWHRGTKPIPFGRFEFRLWAERDGIKRQMNLDEVVENVSWETGDRGLLTGSITVHRTQHGNFDIHVGDVLLLEYSLWGQESWKGLWRMRLTQPEYQIGGHQYVYQLEDDLLRLARSKITVSYRKNRSHPNGWRADEAIRDVCARFDIPVGRVPRMKRRIKKLHFVKQAPLTMLARLLRMERTETGVRYFLRWQNGKINILPFQRSDTLLLMGAYVIDGTLIETQKDAFATVLDLVAVKNSGHGTHPNGRHRVAKTKLKTTVRASAKLIRQYGTVRATVHHNDADSIADLRKWGKRELARRVKINRDFTFTHPGVPTLRTGDAIRVHIPAAALNHVICFVASISHSVQPGDYTMDITVQFDDPYIDKKAERAAAKRAAAAAKRNRLVHDQEVSDARAQARKAAQRS